MKLRHLNTKEKLSYFVGRINALNKRYDKIWDSVYIERLTHYTEKIKALGDEIEYNEVLEREYPEHSFEYWSD